MKLRAALGIAIFLCVHKSAVAGGVQSVQISSNGVTAETDKEGHPIDSSFRVYPLGEKTRFIREFYLSLFLRWQITRIEFDEQLGRLCEKERRRFEELSQKESSLNRREQKEFKVISLKIAQMASLKLRNDLNGSQKISERHHFGEKFIKGSRLNKSERQGLKEYYEQISQALAQIDPQDPSFENYRSYYKIQSKKCLELKETLTLIENLPTMEEQILNWEDHGLEDEKEAS